MIKCRRCGLAIQTSTTTCPSCGFKLGISDEAKSERDYYTLLGLLPKMSHSEISIRIKDAVRYWARQASNASQIEQRHKAEMMLQYLSEAESILLDPLKRKNYDEKRRNTTAKKYETPSTQHSENGKSYKAASTTCPRCGLKQRMYSVFCPACGFKFSDYLTDDTVVIPTYPNSEVTDDQDMFSPKTQAYDATRNVDENSTQQGFTLLGWRKLIGIVIVVEPPYMATVQTGWLSFFLKLSLGILFLPILLGVVAGVMIMRMTFSFLGFGKSDFSSGIISQMVGYFLTHRLLKPKEQISVRDVRLRDKHGQEHLVRIRGELVAGNMNVGDEIEVEGFNRRGTLMIRRGFNKRTRSEIRVRRR